MGTSRLLPDGGAPLGGEPVPEARRALPRRCADVRYLGSWPTGTPAGALPPSTEEAVRWLAAVRDGKPEPPGESRR